MIRIVKLHFHSDNIAAFESLFAEVYPFISRFEGCGRVELLQSEDDPAIFFTYSFWKDAQALENYRSSDLFARTWARTKVLFAHKAEAWSVSRREEFIR